MAAWLGRYDLAAGFGFRGPAWLRPPVGDFEGNAPVEIYKRRQRPAL
jgi:hypothetical protein